MRTLIRLIAGIIQNYCDTKIIRRIRYFLIMTMIILLALIFATITWSYIPGIIDPYNPPKISGWWIAALLYLWFFGVSAAIIPPFGPLGKLFVTLLKLRDSGRYGRGGNARFAGFFEENMVKDVQAGKGSIFLGRSLFSGDNVYLTDERHMITLAGSRSGKGAACIIPNLLRYSGSVLCIDPKGTNARVTAQAHARATNVVVLDPFGQTDLPQDSYNPLDTLDPASRTIVEEIALITDALIIDESKDNQHFSESAKILLSGFIAHVISCGRFKNPSLTDVYDLINTPTDDPARLPFEMRNNPACSGLAQAAAKKIEETKGDKEFNSTWSTLTRNLKWLASVPMRDFLAKSTFDIDQMKYRKSRFYLVLPPNMMKTHAAFLRLFVNLTMSRYSKGTPASHPGLFIIDEAHSLGYMQDIAKGYGLMASYKMILWTFWQDKGQIDKLYGEESGTMFGSSRAIQLFNLNGSDAKWAAEMIGTREAVDANRVATAGAIVNFRDAGSVTTEIGSDSKKQYVIRPGETPLLLERVPYFLDKHLVSDYGPLGVDPDHPGRSKAHKAILRENTVGLIAGMIFFPTLPFFMISGIAAVVITSPFYWLAGAPFYWLAGADVGDLPGAFRIVWLLIYLAILVYYVVNFREFWANEREKLKKWRD